MIRFQVSGFREAQGTEARIEQFEVESSKCLKLWWRFLRYHLKKKIGMPLAMGEHHNLRHLQLKALEALLCLHLAPETDGVNKKMKTRIYLLSALFPFFLLQTQPVSAWQLNITPQASVTEEVNDNIYSQNDNEEDDYILHTSLGLIAEAKTKNSSMKASYFPQYNYYGRNTELSNWSHRADFFLESKPTKHSKFQLRDQFAYTEDPYFTADVERKDFKGIPDVDVTIRQDRENYTTNTAQATLSYETQNKHTIEANYVYGILRNNDETIENSQRNQPSIDIGYNLSKHSSLDGSATYTKGDFEETEDFDQWEGSLTFNQKLSPHLTGRLTYRHYLMDFEKEKTNYQVYDPTVGFDYQLGKQTDVSIDAGYFYRNAGAAQGDESGPSGSLQINHRLEKSLLSLSANVGAVESYFGAENLGFAIRSGGRLRFAYLATRELSVNASAGYSRSDYKDEKIGGKDELRKDEVTDATLGLAYIPPRWKWLMFNLSYAYRYANSNEDEKDYTSNRVFFSITMTPERPFKWNF